MKAAIYVRVSSKQQVEKVSLDEQVSTCEELCQTRGLEVGEVFREEGRSASKDTLDNRPVMTALLDRIDAGDFGAVVAFAPNRISRNDLSAQVIVLRLKVAGAVLVTPEFTMDPQDPTERLTAYMQFWSAGRDSDARSKAVKMGKSGLRKRGRFPESRSPYGYRWEKAPRGVSGEGRPVVDAREESNVRLVFRLAGQGLRPQEICDELTRRGLETRSQQRARDLAAQGKEPKRDPAPWEPNTIARMVRRREYLGEWQTDAATKWADPPKPMISRAVWERAQVAGTRKTVGRRRHRREFLLQGHLTCEVCGKRLSIAQPMNDARYRYYRCGKGCRPYIHALPLERAVWAFVAERIRQPELIAEAVDRYHEHGVEAWREELGTLELAVIGCDQTIEKAEEGFLHGLWGEGRVSAIQQMQRDKKAELEAQIGALRSQIDKGEEHEARVRATEVLLRRLKDPDGMTFEQKRRVLEALGVEVALGAEGSEKAVITWLGAALSAGPTDL